MCARKGLRGELLKDERALTLIELLVVILILAILVTVGMGVYIGQQEKAHDSATRQQLTVAHKASRSALVFRHNRLPAPGQTADFVADLQSEEPSIAFESGSHYPEGKVAVELVQEAGKRKLIMRSRSRSGNYYRLLSSADGEVERQWASEVAASEPAVNLFKFPSFEGLSGTSGYVFDYSGSGGHEFSTDWKTSGSESVHWWGSAGTNNTEDLYLRMPYNNRNTDRPEIEPNTEYTFSVDIYALDIPDKPITFRIQWYQGTSYLGLYEDQVALSPGVGRYSLTATSPSNANYARVQLGWASSAYRLKDETWDFYIDSVRFSEGTETDYFDGSDEFEHTSWTGVAHRSASEREGIAETPAGGVWKRW